MCRARIRSRRRGPCLLILRLCQDRHGVLQCRTQEQRWTGSCSCARSIVFGGPACSDFDAFGHHTEVGLAVALFFWMLGRTSLGLAIDHVQVALVTSVGLLVHISDDIQHSPFGHAQSPVSQACPQRPTSVQSRSRNPVPPLFSPPPCGSSRALTLQKSAGPGSSTLLRPRGSGPFWQMHGQASPEEQASKRNPKENYHDCNRIRDQAS